MVRARFKPHAIEIYFVYDFYFLRGFSDMGIGQLLARIRPANASDGVVYPRFVHKVYRFSRGDIGDKETGASKGIAKGDVAAIG